MQCPHCSKKYQIKLYYDRHVVACELLNKTKRERDNDMEIAQDTPNVRELYDIILEMNHTIQNLQKKVVCLEGASKQKYKKINIIDWLPTQKIPACNWDYWCDSVQFNESNLLHCFQTNIVTSIFECIKQYCEDITLLPIRAFHQKLNIFYIYTDRTWNELNYTHFEKLICKLHKLCTIEFTKWQVGASTEMKGEMFMETFSKNIKNINSQTPQEISKKVHNRLYKYLKMNIKNIIEFDFD